MPKARRSSYRNPLVSALCYAILYLAVYTLYHWVFWKEIAIPMAKQDFFYSKSVELVLGTVSMGVCSLIVEVLRNLIGKRTP